MNMAYILYIYIYIFNTKNGVLGGPKCCIHGSPAEFYFKLLKLVHLLRPFLKTRSHDRSAHTLGSSHQFLEVPQKGFFKMIFWHFYQSGRSYLIH